MATMNWKQIADHVEDQHHAVGRWVERQDADTLREWHRDDHRGGFVAERHTHETGDL